MLNTYVDLEVEFDAVIKNTYKTKPEIAKFILTHERKLMHIEALQKEIKLAEWRVGTLLTASTRKQIIHDLAIMFAKYALQHKEEQLLSDAEKTRRIREADYINRVNEEYDYDLAEMDKDKTRTKIYLGG